MVELTAEAAELNDQLLQLRQLLSVTVADKEEISAELGQLQADHITLTTQHRELADLHANYKAGTEAQLDELRALIDGNRADLDVATQHLRDAGDDADALQRQLEAAEAAVDDVRRELTAALDDARTQADRRVRSLTRRLADADAMAEVERQKCAAAQSAVDELGERNRLLLLRLADAEAEIQAARDAEEIARRNVVRLRGAVQDLESRTAAANNGLRMALQHRGT